MAVFCYVLRSPLEWVTSFDFLAHEANIALRHYKTNHFPTAVEL